MTKPHTFSVNAAPFEPTKITIGSGEAAFTVSPGTTQWKGPQKNGSEVDGLSALAKPWIPPQVEPGKDTVSTTTATPDKLVTPQSPKWVFAECRGKQVCTPVPMLPNDVENNLFVHSFLVVPQTHEGATLEIYNYRCARCSLKTLYGKLSSRKVDVVLQNIARDVPPMCIAHLVEQITKARVTAIWVNEQNPNEHDIWLEKPGSASQIVESLSGRLWSCPNFHGVAVYATNDEGKKFLEGYVDEYQKTPEYALSPFAPKMVVAREH